MTTHLPEGEDSVQDQIDRLRADVVNLRKVKAQLESADKQIDRKVKALSKQKEEVGFVLGMAEEAGRESLKGCQTRQRACF